LDEDQGHKHFTFDMWNKIISEWQTQCIQTIYLFTVFKFHFSVRTTQSKSWIWYVASHRWRNMRHRTDTESISWDATQVVSSI